MSDDLLRRAALHLRHEGVSVEEFVKWLDPATRKALRTACWKVSHREERDTFTDTLLAAPEVVFRGRRGRLLHRVVSFCPEAPSNPWQVVLACRPSFLRAGKPWPRVELSPVTCPRCAALPVVPAQPVAFNCPVT